MNGSDSSNELWQRSYQVYSSLGNSRTQNGLKFSKSKASSAAFCVMGYSQDRGYHASATILTTDEGVANHAVQEMTAQRCELKTDSVAISSWAVQSIGSLLGPSRLCSRQKKKVPRFSLNKRKSAWWRLDICWPCSAAPHFLNATTFHSTPYSKSIL
jgi:hypothetical protein